MSKFVDICYNVAILSAGVIVSAIVWPIAFVTYKVRYKYDAAFRREADAREMERLNNLR